MTDVLYEFPPPDHSRACDHAPPPRKWLIALLLGLLVVAAVGGLYVLERKWSEAFARNSFRLETDLQNRVIAAIAQVPVLSAESIDCLVDYPDLKLLDLGGTARLEGGLSSLQQFENLRVLNLHNCVWVDDDQAVWLQELRSLKRLDLSGTRITDTALLAIRDLPQLSALNLERCHGVTDAGLEVCAGMKPLRGLWPGGAGYSIDGLFALRERRRDLNLQLQPGDLFGPDARNSESPISIIYAGDVRSPSGRNPGAKAILSTSADIERLKGLLRLKNDWLYGRFQDQTPLRTVGDVHESNYVEQIEQTWRYLELHGPPAGSSLAKVFPLAPNLSDLSLYETTLSEEDFPFDLVPPRLHQLHLSNLAVSQSFLRRLSQQTNVKQVELIQTRVHDVLIDHALVGQNPTFLQAAGLADAAARDADEKIWTTIELRGKSTGQSLAKLLPLVPELRVLEIAHSFDAEDFPFELLPPKLQRLHITNAEVSERFLRRLSQHVALEHLVLYWTALDDIHLTEPALGELSTLKSLRLQYIKVNGVDLADPTLEPLRARLKAQLPETWTVIYASSYGTKPIEWGNPTAH